MRPSGLGDAFSQGSHELRAHGPSGGVFAGEPRSSIVLPLAWGSASLVMSLAKQLFGHFGDLLVSNKFTGSARANDSKAPTH